MLERILFNLSSQKTQNEDDLSIHKEETQVFPMKEKAQFDENIEELNIKSIDSYLYKRPMTAKTRNLEYTVPTTKSYQRVLSAKNKLEKRKVETIHLNCQMQETHSIQGSLLNNRRPITARILVNNKKLSREMFTNNVLSGVNN